MPEISPRNMLLCVFSFNMGKALANCLDSIGRHCAGFDVVLADDQSDDPETVWTIERYRSIFAHVHPSTKAKTGQRHGNLYSNIQEMCGYARSRGYRYLFMIQDDMQFVRPLDAAVCREYGGIFDFDRVLQVDPRFLRPRSGAVEIRRDMHAYSFLPGDDRRSYADVGILDLEVLRRLDWHFLPSERENKVALSRLGYLRVFPFTPVFMHVPFPEKYSKGRKRVRFFPYRRGMYSYHDMSADEISAMDGRDIGSVPYYKDFLKPKNLGLARIFYDCRKDRRIFG